jgi:GTPase SAR1 family protein
VNIPVDDNDIKLNVVSSDFPRLTTVKNPKQPLLDLLSFWLLLIADFFLLSILLCSLTVYQWDTAGQERFNTITANYFRNAHAIVIVYDITRQETFDHLFKWVKVCFLVCQ